MPIRRSARPRHRPTRRLFVVLAVLCLGAASASPSSAGSSVAGKGRSPLFDQLAAPRAESRVDDWLSAADPTAMPIRPADGATVLQSPPGFTWPDLAPEAVYDFRLTAPDGSVLDRHGNQNFLLLDSVLPAGRYAWQLRIRDDATRGWSNARMFDVPAGALPFPVPEISALWQRAVAAPHPRLLPQGEDWMRHRADLLQGRRATLFARVQDAVGKASGTIFRPDPADAPPPAADLLKPGWWPQPGGQLYRAELEALERAAMVWRVTGDQGVLTDARARLENALSWPSDGAVAFAHDDQLAMDYAWGLAVAFDLLHDTLTREERARVTAAVAASAVPAYVYFLNNPDGHRYSMQASPLNSHGYGHLANLAALSVIFAGELAQAKAWFDSAVPMLLAMPHPWGGDDGGSGNGGNYAFYYMVDLMPRWDALRNGIGIDPAATAWAQNFPVYAAYFQGPLMPFMGGDGAGHGDGLLAGTVMRSLYARTGSKLARWYSMQVPYSYPIPHMMELTAPTAPPAATAGPAPAELPDAALLPSIGWAALHSDILARDKASIYFRSGPFGSDSHNDADQNSFTVRLNRHRLAIDSGYYDEHDSPHMMAWTRQTRAHNAITFDGGDGQPAKRLDTSGRITHFADDGRLATVGGDATGAYDGALTDATRTLAFLRPSLLLVYDRLSSATPRTYEWNIHSLGDMVPYARNALGIAEGDQSLCVEMLTPGGLVFAKSDRYGVSDIPPNRSDMKRHWHARFASPRKVTDMEFLALLRLNCDPTPVSDLALGAAGGFTLTLGNNRLAIGPAGASLNPQGGER